MVVVLDTSVGFYQPTSIVSIGAGDTTLDLVNLGVLTSVRSGQTGLAPVRFTTYSLTQPDGNNGHLSVGETFTGVRTVTNSSGGVVGTPQTFTVVMQGSGSFQPLAGPARPFIIAFDAANNQQYFIFPNNNPPALLDLVASVTTVSQNGYNFPGLLACFVRGTMILTDTGEQAVEDIKVGDLIMTKDNGFKPVSWIGMAPVAGDELQNTPKLRPIRISAGALGNDTPSRDLFVSPQHRILVRSAIAQKMFGTNEILVAAKQLLQLDGIDVVDAVDGVEYYHILFDRHEVVLSNGAETESLYTGPEALRSVGVAAQEEIFTLFPQLRSANYEAVPARTLVSGRMGRQLAVRHMQNSKALVR